jgi:hypothetical protein
MLRFFCTSQNLLKRVDQRLLAVGVAMRRQMFKGAFGPKALYGN